MTATSGSSDSINTYFIKKALACHPNFRKCTLTVEYIAVLRVTTLIFGENSENLPNGFVMQHQILINVIIFVAYVLNFPLNTRRSHSRSQRAGKWSLILAHDRRPIYRAPTYIAVPLLGHHQPRYIGLTLYKFRTSFLCIGMSKAYMRFYEGYFSCFVIALWEDIDILWIQWIKAVCSMAIGKGIY